MDAKIKRNMKNIKEMYNSKLNKKHESGAANKCYKN